MTAPAVPRETKAAARPPRPVASLDDILLELVDVDDNVRDDVGDLTELQASISELGLLSPVKVTKQSDGRYRLVYGQRRVLACRAIGRTKISAIVEPASDVDQVGARRSIEQLAENLQRKDLNPIEEAVALREVLDADPKLTQEALADQLAMSRPWVSNTLGLLEAAPAVQELVRAGTLTASHAKALRGLAPKTQADFAEQAVERGYSAHEVERSVQQWKHQEQWERERRTSTEAEHKARTEALVAGMAKKKVPLDAAIYVTGYNWVTAAAAAIKKAGYTKVVEGTRDVGSRAEAIGCDCSAWLVRVDYATTITGACIVQAHREAKRKSEHESYLQGEALRSRVRGRLAEVLVAEISTLGPLAARVLLWRVLGWELDTWAKAEDARLVNSLDESKPKRKKVDPWATLMATDVDRVRAELTRRIASGVHDGNFKVGWESFAAELGVLEPPARPAKAKKAAPA